MKPYLFVGLGNIGKQYVNTRHNVGFDVVDELANTFNTVFTLEKLASVSSYSYRGRVIHLIKPTTYMNLSGRAFRYYKEQFSVPLENCLVIVDDLALPFGKLRLKGKGSAAGHNGLKSIEQEVGKHYPRLRFGIGDDFRKGQQIDYVLGQWTRQQQEELPSYINEAAKICQSFVAQGLQNTMNEFN